MWRLGKWFSCPTVVHSNTTPPHRLDRNQEGENLETLQDWLQLTSSGWTVENLKKSRMMTVSSFGRKGNYKDKISCSVGVLSYQLNLHNEFAFQALQPHTLSLGSLVCVFLTMLMPLFALLTVLILSLITQLSLSPLL